MRKRTALLAAIVVSAVALSTAAPAFADPTPTYSLTTSNPSVGFRESLDIDAVYPAQGCWMALFTGDTLGSSGLPCAYIQLFNKLPRSLFSDLGSAAGSVTIRFYSAASAGELDRLDEGIDPLDVSYEASVTIDYEAAPADRAGWMTISQDLIDTGSLSVDSGDLAPNAPYSISLISPSDQAFLDSLGTGVTTQAGSIFETPPQITVGSFADGWYTLRFSTTAADGQLIEFDGSFGVKGNEITQIGPVFEFGPDANAPVESSSLATAAVVSGTRSAALANFSFLDPSASDAKYSHVDQVASGVSLLTVDDSSGTGLGWAVTEQVSNVEWIPAGGAVSGVVLTAADYSIASVDAVSTAAGQAWSGSRAVAGALDSPVTVLSAQVGAGSGRYTVPVHFALRLPGQSRIGTYTATLTTTMTVAP